jgi:4-hydroxythreonine-4-phosphate dehydrogenase
MGVPDALPRIRPGDALPRSGALVEVGRLPARDRRPGKPGPAALAAQVAYLEAAIAFVRGGGAEALCTAPITKAALHAAGLRAPGHTELLQQRFRARRVVMMLAGPSLRVVLATTHLALADVPRALRRAGLVEILQVTDAALRRRFGVPRPRIAVCGLNPHAGDGGLFGDEEARIIAPAIARARAAGVRAEGPFAADGLFAGQARGFDAVLAMYHDQGLIPVKALDFERTVNVTLGLPIVRTSPDHGVAYDIAGTGSARPSSMIEALRMAAAAARGPSRGR